MTIDWPTHALSAWLAYVVCGLLGYSVGGAGLAILVIGALGPDLLTNTPMYIKLRRRHGYWPMKTADWSGYQKKMSGLYKFYMACHSFLACGMVLMIELAVIQVTGWYPIPLFSIGYLLHVLYDTQAIPGNSISSRFGRSPN